MTAFGDCAPVWWSLAAQILGWRPDEFWQATPAELSRSLTPPDQHIAGTPPDRDLIARLMERDANG